MAGNFEAVGVEAIVEGFNQFLRRMDKIDKAIASSGTASKTASLGVAALNTAFSAVAAVAAVVAAAIAAVTIAVGGLVIQSTKVAASFESAFTGVLKTTDGLGENFSNLTVEGEKVLTQFRDLATQVPRTFEELANIGELAGQLGVGRQALVGFTEAVVALGVSTNLTEEAAASAIATIGNIFQVAEEDFVEFTNNFGSAVVDLGNNFNTTEAQIVAFAERIAGTGKVVGLTEADIAGIGAAFTSVGVEAEAGGTAVQKVLIALAESVASGAKEVDEEYQSLLFNIVEEADVSVDKLAKIINEGGDAFDDLAGDIGRSTDEIQTALNLGLGGGSTDALNKFAEVAGVTASEFVDLFQNDAAAAFDLFVQGLGASGDEAFAILEELELGDQRLIRSFLSAASAGDLLTDAIDRSNEAFGEGTALTEEAAKFYDTFASSLDVVKNQFRDIAFEIGRPFLEFLKEGLDAAQPFLDALRDGVSNAIEPIGDALTNDLIPALVRIADALGIGTPNVEDFSDAIAQATDVIVGAINGFADFADAVADLISAFKEGGTGGLIDALGLSDAQTAKINTFIAGVITGFIFLKSTVIAAIEAIKPAFDGLVTTFQENEELITTIFTAIVTGIGIAVTIIVAIFVGLVNAISAFVTAAVNFINQFKTTFETVLGIVGEIVAAAMNFILGLITFDLERIGMAFIAFWEAVKLLFTEGFAAIFELFVAQFALLLEPVSAFITSVIEFFQLLFDELVGNSIIPDMFAAIIEVFSTSFEELAKLVKDFIQQKIVAPFKALIGKLKTIGAQIIQGLIDGIASKVEEALEFIGEVAGQIGDAFAGVLGIESPSTLFRGYGQDMMAGLTQGLLDGAASAVDVTDMIASRVAAPVSVAAGVASGSIDNSSTINNEVNMTVDNVPAERALIDSLVLIGEVQGGV